MTRTGTTARTRRTRARTGPETYYEYNDNGLASKVIPTAGSPTEFHYDARMQRFAVDWAGTLSYFLWDGMNQLEERADDLSLTAQHMHGATPIEGIGTIIVTKRGAEHQYPHYDHRGSLFDLEDTGAGVADLEAEFNAFGEELERSGDAVTRFGYQGTAWMRSDSGLLVSPTRLYLPGAGRFGASDPFAVAARSLTFGRYSGSILVDHFVRALLIHT